MSNRVALTFSVGAFALGCLLTQASPGLAADADGKTGVLLAQAGSGTGGTMGSGMGSPGTGGAPGMGSAGPGRNDSTGATKQDGRDHSFQGGSGHSGNAMTQDPATKRPDSSQRR